MFPFTTKPSVLTKTEFAFYRALLKVLDGRFLVLPKMRLLDVFFMRGTRYDHPHDFGRVVGRHVDFVLCDANTLCPEVGIELDDWTHGSPKAMARDAYIDELFARTGLPLLRFRAETYDAAEIAARLAPHARVRAGATTAS